jgi:hypothetical protein
VCVGKSYTILIDGIIALIFACWLSIIICLRWGLGWTHLQDKRYRTTLFLLLFFFFILLNLMYFLKSSLDKNLIVVHSKFNCNFKSHINFKMIKRIQKNGF